MIASQQTKLYNDKTDDYTNNCMRAIETTAELVGMPVWKQVLMRRQSWEWKWKNGLGLSPNQFIGEVPIVSLTNSSVSFK